MRGKSWVIRADEGAFAGGRVNDRNGRRLYGCLPFSMYYRFVFQRNAHLPAAPRKFRLLKLDGQHIRFVFDCLRENTTHIWNMKQHLLTVLSYECWMGHCSFSQGSRPRKNSS